MGGDSALPYIYEPSSRRIAYPYSDFNPKAVTQASYQALEEQKRRSKATDSTEGKNGPLINFNAHPDSYMVVAGQNVNYKTMPANTKKMVTVVRWVQFALRVVEEIGALGILVCVICIKGMQVSQSWIMRIAPAWDAVITLYAIYHLIRPAKARTPANSASYHFFALVMDAGLLPFYIFIALFANNNYVLAPGTDGRWTSYFTAAGATTLVLFVTFIGSAVMTGLHFLSVALDLWLVILFRKISKLPPDMNPLEDNLTGRSSSRASRPSKHKHKNSELTLSGDSMTEKKSAYLSGSTLSVDQSSRLSTATAKDAPRPDSARTVPFRHSRMGSEATFSPHNPETARWSRQQFEEVSLYQQSHSARSSQNNVHGSHSRTGSAVTGTPSKLGSYVDINEQLEPPPRSPARLHPGFSSPSQRPISYPTSNTSRNNLAVQPPSPSPSPNRYYSPALPNAAPSNALVKSQQKQGLLTTNSNWYAMSDNDDVSDLGTPPSRQRTSATTEYSTRSPVSPIERHDSFGPAMQPLKMNPPTPRVQTPEREDENAFEEFRRHDNRMALTDRRDLGNGDSKGGLDRHLTVQSTATNSSSVYSESAPSLKSSVSAVTKVASGSGTTPKGKYYGDLAAATRGVRGFASNGTLNAAAFDATGMCALGDYGYSAPPPPPPPVPQLPKIRESPSSMRGGGEGRKERRVVSRTTGADIAVVDFQTQAQARGQAHTPYPGESGMRGRRDVSGKVAEEGRAGGGAGPGGAWWGRGGRY